MGLLNWFERIKKEGLEEKAARPTHEEKEALERTRKLHLLKVPMSAKKR